MDQVKLKPADGLSALVSNVKVLLNLPHNFVVCIHIISQTAITFLAVVIAHTVYIQNSKQLSAVQGTIINDCSPIIMTSANFPAVKHPCLISKLIYCISDIYSP
jgi:Na+-transporting NADH:ubiquinone oxidoreductase subunit NqrD